MTISYLTLIEYEDALGKWMLKYLLWCICQLHSSTVSQHIPRWAGFILKTNQGSKHLTKIGHYPSINHPTKDYSTVQKWLRVSKNASQKVGQKYAVTTSHLDVCMQIYPTI